MQKASISFRIRSVTSVSNRSREDGHGDGGKRTGPHSVVLTDSGHTDMVKAVQTNLILLLSWKPMETMFVQNELRPAIMCFISTCYVPSSCLGK